MRDISSRGWRSRAGGGNDELWRKFCRVAGLDAFAADPRFATNRDRVRNYGALRPIVAEAFSKHTDRSGSKC